MTTFPSIGEADRHRLSYILETTYGVTPSGNLKRIRHTGETLKRVTQTKDSEEIRDDGQVADVFRTSYKCAGDFKFELSFGNHDDWMMALLRSAAWSDPVTFTSSAVTFTASDNSINATSIGTGMVANSWIKITGAGTNSGYAKLVSAASGKLVVKGKTLTDAAPGASITIVQGGQIVNGVAKHSFSMERSYTDLTNEYVKMTGLVAAVGAMAFNVGSMATGSFSLEGADYESATATIGTGYTASNTNSPMNVVDNSILFVTDAEGTYAQFACREWGFSVTNNVRERTNQGEGAPSSYGFGNFKPSGTLNAYYNTKNLIDKYLNFQDVAMAQIVEDGAGRAYIFDVPRAKLTDGSRSGESQNSDIMKKVAWSAYVHPTEGITMRIVRFP